ncbi:hypothetical protein BT69DRAFT_1350386 [Atractiella rhizophila]|nr:hypothetical protein BT69DRAFT_1350386 [Atractiella rhizophila]
MVSWGIVCYKSIGPPTLNKAYLTKAMMDENVQYLALAIFWYTRSPIYVTMLPFATFSLFHTLTFIRTNVLPKAPSGSSAAPATGAAAASQKLQVWIKANYETAMLFVSYVESVAVMGRLLLGVVLFFTRFGTGIVAPLLFAHFLRLRYFLSPQTRAAFTTINAYVERINANPQIPPQVKQGIATIRALLLRYSNSILQVPNQPAAGHARRDSAQGAAAAGAGGRTE